MSAAVRTSAVAELVRRRFPEWADLPVERIATDGTVNAIFRIGDAAAIRVPRDAEDPDAVRATLRAEASAMGELAAACPVPTPAPLGVGEPGDPLGLPWSAQTWIPGDVATPTGLADSAGFADDLADLVLALRRTDTRGRTFAGSGRGGALTDHDAWVAECLDRSAGLVDVERAAALWDGLRDLPREEPDAMTHGDLIPPNLVVRDGRLAGLLDGGGFGPADPALDLVGAWHLLDREARERMRRRVGASDVAWRRGAAWALEQALGLVWYYRETLPGMSELGSTTVGRLLSDPEVAD